MKDSFRQYKILTFEGRFINNPRKNQVYKKKYYTCSFWLSPKTLMGKHPVGYQIKDHCFLGAELLLDFDNTKYDKTRKVFVQHSWKQVHAEVIRALDFFATKPYKLKRIQFSGSHGFHVIYDDATPYEEASPKKRLERFYNRRTDLFGELQRLNLPTLDIKLILNPYQVYKVPESIDWSTGYYVQEIAEERFRNEDIRTILGSLKREAMMRSATPQHILGVGGTRITPPPQIIKMQYVTNRVYGVKDSYIPSIVVNRIPLALLELQRRYRLGTLYIFKTNDSFLVLSLKISSKRRLIKIMRAFDSLNLNHFIRYGHCKVHTNLALINVVRDKVTGQYSRSHSHLLKRLGISTDVGELVGIPEFGYMMNRKVVVTT